MSIGILLLTQVLDKDKCYSLFTFWHNKNFFFLFICLDGKEPKNQADSMGKFHLMPDRASRIGRERV